MSGRCCLLHRWQEIPPWSLPSGTWQQVYNFFCAEEVIPSFPSDKKNGFRNFVLSVMVEMGVHKKGDGLDPDGLKAKLVFGITQLIYTLITISPVSIYSDVSLWVIHIFYPFQTLFFFSSYALSCGWMVLAYSWGTWNGACYYIEVLKSRDPKYFEFRILNRVFYYLNTLITHLIIKFWNPHGS